MEVEMIEVTGTEVTVQDRAAIALNTTKAEKDLRELAEKNKSIVLVIDKAGREQAHGAGMELRRARTTIEKLSKEAREDAKNFSKAVIAEAARLTLIIEPEETRILALRDEWDAEQERIKAEKEAANRARILAINERIAAMRGYVNMALECRGSDRIQTLQDKLASIEVTEEAYGEFLPEALAVLAEAGRRVDEILTSKLADEAERTRIKAEQEAAAAALVAQRSELAAQQAAAKLEADKVAAERAAFEAEKREFQEAKEAREAAVQAAANAALAQQTYQQDYAALAQVMTPDEPPAPAEPPATHVEPPEPEEAIHLTGVTVEILPAPSAEALIRTIANAYSCTMQTAADWLFERSHEIETFGDQQ